MKKILVTLSLFVAAFILNNIPSQAMGLFYSNVSGPITATGVKSDVDISQLKEGTSESINVLGLVHVGDSGIDTAAKNGNIKQVHFIDTHLKSVFIFFMKSTTHVYGE